jgi:hypothetical protein
MLKPRATMDCIPGSCPAVFENDNGDYVIIGKRPSDDTLEELSDRIGEDELAVIIPAELLEKLVNDIQSDD